MYYLSHLDFLNDLNQDLPVFYLNPNFKKGLFKKIISGLCNEPQKNGGYIFIGPDQDQPNYIHFIKDPKLLQEALRNIFLYDFNYPVCFETKLINIEDHTIIKFHIFEQPYFLKPLSFYSENLIIEAYRLNNTTFYLCDKEDYDAFRKDLGFWEICPIIQSNYDDINLDALAQLYTYITNSKPPENMLKTLDSWFLNNNLAIFNNNEFQLSLLGVLAIGKSQYIQSFFPQFGFKIIYDSYHSKTFNLTKKQITIIDNFIDMPTNIIQTILALSPFFKSEGIADKLKRFYQELIILLIKFLILKRSYHLNKPVTIDIEHHKITIRCPGYIALNNSYSLNYHVQPNPYLEEILNFYLPHEFAKVETSYQQCFLKYNLPKLHFKNNTKSHEFMISIGLPEFVRQNNIHFLLNLNLSHKFVQSNDDLSYGNELLPLNGGIEFNKLTFPNVLKLYKYQSNLKKIGFELFYQHENKSSHLNDFEFLEWSANFFSSSESSSKYSSFYLKDTANQSKLIKKFVEASNIINLSKFWFETITKDLNSYKNFDIKDLYLNHHHHIKLIEYLQLQQFSNYQNQIEKLPKDLEIFLINLKTKVSKNYFYMLSILYICNWRPQTLYHLSIYLNKNPKYILINFMKPLRDKGYVGFTERRRSNHPNQAYKTLKIKIKKSDAALFNSDSFILE